MVILYDGVELRLRCRRRMDDGGRLQAVFVPDKLLSDPDRKEGRPLR